jgi:hypothetical protein
MVPSGSTRNRYRGWLTSARWYSASLPETTTVIDTVEVEQPVRPAKRVKPTKPQRNPYSPSANQPLDTTPLPHAGPSSHRASPSYIPPSPPSATNRPEHIQPEQHAMLRDPQPRTADMSGAQIGIQPAANVSRSEAISNAMMAQYWAGYWMGVAEAKIDTGIESNKVEPGTRATGQGEPPNVFITRQNFGRANGLKR